MGQVNRGMAKLRDEIIDLGSESEGSSQDSYISAEDSPGSLCDFIVDTSSSEEGSSESESSSGSEWEPENYCRRCKKAFIFPRSQRDELTNR